MSAASLRKRRILLAASFAVPAAVVAAILFLAPRMWWLLAVPAVIWAGMFLAFAWLRLKDPGYYGD